MRGSEEGQKGCPLIQRQISQGVTGWLSLNKCVRFMERRAGKTAKWAGTPGLEYLCGRQEP